jgi:putative FmdB family regulatory protein
MAVYEYECRACGERFELRASMAEHDSWKGRPPACPGCAGTDTNQLVSTFSCKAPSKY